MNDHDHGDEDRRTRHKFSPLTLDEVEYALAVGARDAGYHNPRSRDYRRVERHLSTCAISRGGCFCTCLGLRAKERR